MRLRLRLRIWWRLRMRWTLALASIACFSPMSVSAADGCGPQLADGLVGGVVTI